MRDAHILNRLHLLELKLWHHAKMAETEQYRIFKPLFKGVVWSNQLHGGRCESEMAPYTNIKVLFYHNEVNLHPNQ